MGSVQAGRSIRVKFILMSVAAVTLILAVFAAWQFTTAKQRLTEALDTYLRGVNGRLSNIVPNAVWSFDPQSALTALDAELDHPAIIGFAVRLEDGTAFVSLRKTDSGTADFDPESEPRRSHEFDAETKLERDGKVLGTLLTRHSERAIEAELRSAIVSSLLQTLVIDVVVSLIIAFLISSLVVRPLELIGTNLKEISQGEGDLTKALPVRGSDEIAELSSAFNDFQIKLSSLIAGVRASFIELHEVGHDLNSSSTETAAAIHEIASNIGSIRNEVSRQAQAAQSTSDTARTVSSTVDILGRRIEEQFGNIQVASSAVEEMVANVKSVTAVVESLDAEYRELIRASETGRARLTEVNDRVAAIMAHSANLEEANVLIANIASQTNLLAMNAAIEAAHAGEFGKGFSVVADEIRKLAEHSSEQSKTTSAMLKEITKSIATADAASTEAEQAFRNIMDHLSRFTGLERQIDEAMKEQSAGSSQILENLRAMNESSRSVRESAADIEQLNRRISVEIDTLSNISIHIHGSMDEITLGADEVNKAVSLISDMSSRNRDIIGRADRALSRFKTMDACEC